MGRSNVPRSARYLVREPECPQLCRISQPADRHYDVLLSVQHICHRSAALLGRHVNSADLLTRCFVVGPQHRAPLSVWRGENTGLTGDNQCLRNKCTYDAGAA